MRHSINPPPRRLCILSLTLLIVSLAGCGTAPDRPGTDPALDPNEPLTSQTGEILLTLPPSEFGPQFRSAEQFLLRYDWMQASEALARIPPELASHDDLTYMGYLEARIDYTRGEQGEALARLERLDYPGLHPALYYRILNFKRHILEITGAYLDSARLGDQILQGTPEANAAGLKRRIWTNLQRVDRPARDKAMNAVEEPRWRGWLELSLLAEDDTAPLVEQLSAWLELNPEHPAAQPLPGGLQYLLEQPPALERVVLMLPLSGRLAAAGKAVRDGYLASYYAARAAGAAGHEVRVLDLDSYDSPHRAYDEALALDANLVVGPLSKEAVIELGSRLERPVPVLALNRVDQVLPAGSSALVQLSLAPEDEASRIAELAFGRGARRALVIKPAGVWGAKVEYALRQRWSALGGTIADSVSYSSREDYSASVKTSLDLPESERRARDLNRMLGTNLEFTARRRQDLDVIFLLSRNGPEARSLKPLLAFHYAGDLPVYATSSIYSGIPDPRDRDLNGIHLVETPWLLGANPGLRVAIAAGDTGSDSYTRLNALGADAYLVQSRFSQLQAGADALLKGSTGLLSMDPQLRIYRELSPATFDRGALRAQ